MGERRGRKASRVSALGNWIRVMIWTEMGKTARGVKTILFSRRCAEFRGYGFMGGNVFD